MILPDSICVTHGTEMHVWWDKDRTRKQLYCLECRFERDNERRVKHGLPPRKRNGLMNCRRGHPKTAINWRLNVSLNQYYCYRCHRQRVLSLRKPIAGRALVKGHVTRVPDRTILKALREIGREIKCAVCRNDGQWNGKPLALDIMFIDGDWRNADEKNLRILCPNCHRQMKGRRQASGLARQPRTRERKQSVAA